MKSSQADLIPRIIALCPTMPSRKRFRNYLLSVPAYLLRDRLKLMLEQRIISKVPKDWFKFTE